MMDAFVDLPAPQGRCPGSRVTPRMTDSTDRLDRSIFLLTAGALFAASCLRSVLSLTGDALLTEVLLLLVAWLALLAGEAFVTPRWPSFFPLYMTAQTAIVVVLLLAGVDSGDFYAVLFGVLSMQAAQRLGWRSALLWIALFAPLTALPLTFVHSVPEAIVFAAIYTVLNVFLGLFTLATRRAAEARARNRALTEELEAANGELAAYARRTERLAAAGERHRLARELHDSVTQTVFSMNLTAQSAALLLPRDRSAAVAQLDRLRELAQTALGEIRVVGFELAAAELDEDGLASALRRHLAERGLPDDLSVTLKVEGREATGRPPGSGPPALLSPAEELCLFRVAQEALNNIVKHAQAREAAIRLRLSPPCRLEIEDHGLGFQMDEGLGGGGMGLRGMGERAAEVGWSFSLASAPGAGTRIVVEQPSEGRAEQ
jgi:signal transduction histidine kinase